jgi:hypothetical protein
VQTNVGLQIRFLSAEILKFCPIRTNAGEEPRKNCSGGLGVVAFEK